MANKPPIVKLKNISGYRLCAFDNYGLGPKIPFVVMESLVSWLGDPYTGCSVIDVLSREPWIEETLCSLHEEAGVGFSPFAMAMVVVHLHPPAETGLKIKASDLMVGWVDGRTKATVDLTKMNSYQSVA